MKKERYFKCYKFKYLMTDYMIKKQNVNNITEKNDTELIVKKR